MKAQHSGDLSSNRDHQSFNDLFKAYFPALCYFSDKLICDKYKSEELASDSLIKLWEKREHLHQPAAIRSFLYTITKNACLNYLRDSKRTRAKAVAYTITMDSSSPSIEHAIIEAEVLRELYEGLAALSDQCKMIMEQLYIEGKSAAEIAAHTGLAINTIRVQNDRHPQA